MNVTHLTPYISRRAGGMMDCTRGLVASLRAESDVSVKVLSVEDIHAGEDRPRWGDIDVALFPSAGPESFRYARDLAKHVSSSRTELLHTHGLWTYLSIVSARWVRHRGTMCPLVISPQGMLDAWALQNSAWKKRIAANLFENRHLQSAACLHAVSPAEAKSFRQYGLRNPICVIPNGVDLPVTSTGSDIPRWADMRQRGGKVLLFLSRLHPKKGIANLLTAWRQVRVGNGGQTNPWTLVIAGWDQGGHEQELRALAAELHIESAVRFVGPVHGATRDAAYMHADAFILPSHSEGLPLAVLEAWAHRLPIIMTPQCNIPEGFAAGAAVECAPTVDSVATALRALMQMSDDERQRMGVRGRRLVESRFTWRSIAADMADVYRWLVNRAPVPACVQL